jgi:hypothetical protein
MRILPLVSIEQILPTLAVLIGAGWILFNYFVGRTHRPRVQLHVSVERVAVDGLEYLIVKTELNNVGLARVKIDNGGCFVRIFAHKPLKRYEFVMDPKWEEQSIVDLFKDQHWVEPNGSLIDQQLVVIPDLADRFLRVLTHVESTKWLWRKVAWNSYAVVGRLGPVEVAEGN